jgi:hypothetical protein
MSGLPFWAARHDGNLHATSSPLYPAPLIAITMY